MSFWGVWHQPFGRTSVSPQPTLRAKSITATRIEIELRIATEYNGKSLTVARSSTAIDAAVILSGRSTTLSRSTTSASVICELSVITVTESRATITTNTLVAIGFASRTESRSEIVIDCQYQLSVISATKSRISIAMEVETGLHIRSPSDTYSSADIDVWVSLICNSKTQTRATMLLMAAWIIAKTATESRCVIGTDTLVSLSGESRSASRVFTQIDAVNSLSGISNTSSRTTITKFTPFVWVNVHGFNRAGFNRIVLQAPLYCKSSSPSRCSLDSSTATGLELRSVSVARTDIVIVADITLAGRSVTGSRTEKKERHISQTGSRAEVEIFTEIDLLGRSVTASREEVEVDACISLNIRSLSRARVVFGYIKFYPRRVGGFRMIPVLPVKAVPVVTRSMPVVTKSMSVVTKSMPVVTKRFRTKF